MQKQRIWELDAIRGFCILCVIAIHIIFDLQYFWDLELSLPAIYQFIQANGAVIFILISGTCATLGSRSFRRGAIVFSCGLLITVVTLGMYFLGMAGRDIIIHFGILHLLGLSMMLYPLLKKLPTPLLAILGILFTVLGYVLLAHRFQVEYLFVFGIRSPHYAAGDYFPIFPYLGWFCIGIVLGRTAYRNKRTLLPAVPENAALLRFFRFCGRHSLIIYLAHQPIVYVLLMLLSKII